MLNNKRKYFYMHSFIFIVLFFKRNELFLKLKFLLLLLIKFNYLKMTDYLISDQTK